MSSESAKDKSGTTRRQTLSELILETRAAIASGGMTEMEKADLEARCRAAEALPQEEREGHDHFLTHLPPDDADMVLVVLKGHLLIEQRVREFIDERLLNPAALEPAKLESHQAICLAEALTLPNEEPASLWAVVRKLNELRNRIAHNLEPKGVDDRINNIISMYQSKWPVKSGFTGVLAHCYGQLAELCRLARRKEFRIRKD